MLTCPNDCFPGRVGASILTAIELPELIMPTYAAYEQEAIRLGNDPEAIGGIKAKLAVNRTTTPLFDTPRFVRNMEWAYEKIWGQYAAGVEPQMIHVEDC